MPSDNYPPGPPGPPGGPPGGGGFGHSGGGSGMGERPRLEPGFFSRQDQEPFPGQESPSYSAGSAGGRGRMPSLKKSPLIALVSIAIFGVIVWYAYQQGHDAGSVSVPPIIKSDVNPTRVRPQTPGGMEVPHQDKMVYDRVAPSTQEARVERLLPPPEAPLPRQTSPSSALPGADGRLAPAPSFPQTGQFKDIPVPTVPDAPPPQIISDNAPASAPAPRPLVPPPSATLAPPVTPPVASPVAPPVQAAKPAPAVAAQAGASPFKIQLGAVRSDTAARSEWTRLQTRNKDLLGGLTLSVQRVDLGAKGTFFRIKAGPVASETIGRNLCAELTKRKVACLITR